MLTGPEEERLHPQGVGDANSLWECLGPGLKRRILLRRLKRFSIEKKSFSKPA
jgi:hypothetical protein